MDEIRNHPLQHPYFEKRMFGKLSDLKQIFTEEEIEMLIGCGFITIHSSTCANDTYSTCDKTIKNKLLNFIRNLYENFWRP